MFALLFVAIPSVLELFLSIGIPFILLLVHNPIINIVANILANHIHRFPIIVFNFDKSHLKIRNYLVNIVSIQKYSKLLFDFAFHTFINKWLQNNETIIFLDQFQNLLLTRSRLHSEHSMLDTFRIANHIDFVDPFVITVLNDIWLIIITYSCSFQFYCIFEIIHLFHSKTKLVHQVSLFYIVECSFKLLHKTATSVAINYFRQPELLPVLNVLSKCLF